MAQTELKRTLSLSIITFYGIGTILGAGIYVLVGKIAGEAGIYAPISFIFAAIIAGFTGFSYAELSSRFPYSAGEVFYVDEGFNKQWLSRIIGVLVVLTGVVSAATVSRGFIGYFNLFVETPDWIPIILVIAVLGGLAIWGIKESAMVVVAITALEIGGLLFVLFVAGDSLGDLPERIDELIPPMNPTILNGIVLGGFLSFFAFIGFDAHLVLYIIVRYERLYLYVVLLQNDHRL